MPDPKVGKSKDGRTIHYSAAALIWKNGKLLMEDRMKEPLGWACPAGHVDMGETFEQAVDREIWEETGLTITKKKVLHEEEIPWNICRRGGQGHPYKIFEAEVTGKEKMNAEESKNMDWFSPEEIQKLKLEPVWEYFLSKFGIIQSNKKFG